MSDAVDFFFREAQQATACNKSAALRRTERENEAVKSIRREIRACVDKKTSLAAEVVCSKSACFVGAT